MKVGRTIEADDEAARRGRRAAFARPWRATPRECALRSEGAPLPRGAGERFVGYGVMSLPFQGGDILAFRRFGASSIGPEYSAIWHRDRAGQWTFYVSVQPSLACPRYFGAAIERTVVTEIEATWVGHDHLVVAAPLARVEWSMRIQSSLATRALSALASITPPSLWRHEPTMRVLGSAAGIALGAGPMRLSGAAPNGQRFRVQPRRLWRIDASAARVEGRELGPLGGRGAELGDFRLPDTGLFACGSGEFDRLDVARHGSTVARRVERG